MWLGYLRAASGVRPRRRSRFILPPFVIVTIVAGLYVEFRGTTAIQALFYGIGRRSSP